MRARNNLVGRLLQPAIALLLSWSPSVAVAQVVATAQPAASAQAASHSASWDAALARFSETLARDVGADGVGGIVAGVAVDGDLVWARAYGWADRQQQVPMSTSSVSRTGSISK